MCGGNRDREMEAPPSRIIRAICVGIAVTAAVLVLARSIGPVLQSSATLGIFPDNTLTFAPIFHVVNKIVTSGALPLWIPELLGGLAFYNTPQFSFAYPFYFFWID